MDQQRDSMVRSFLLVSDRSSPLILGLCVAFGLLASTGGRAIAAEPNLGRFERAAAFVADSIVAMAGAADTFCLQLAAHPAAWLVEHAVVDVAAARQRIVLRCGSDATDRLEVVVTDAIIVYRETDDSDLLERACRLSISSTLVGDSRLTSSRTGAGPLLRTARFTSEILDTVDIADTSRLGDPSYPFTMGSVVAQSTGGFWSRVVEPAVVLAAAAVVAILLFTVRTQ